MEKERNPCFRPYPGTLVTERVGIVAERTTARTQSLDEQIDTAEKLKDLLDVGVLTQEDFDIKKREIMGL